MAALVIAEHDGASIKGATLNTVTAAAQLGEVHVLIAGLNAIPFKVPAREPVSWGNEEATGERDLGSGD